MANTNIFLPLKYGKELEALHIKQTRFLKETGHFQTGFVVSVPVAITVSRIIMESEYRNQWHQTLVQSYEVDSSMGSALGQFCKNLPLNHWSPRGGLGWWWGADICGPVLSAQPTRLQILSARLGPLGFMGLLALLRVMFVHRGEYTL